jgi:acetate kinase
VEAILTINAGSSSIKFALLGARRLCQGQVERIGRGPRLRVRDGEGRPLDEDGRELEGDGHDGALATILDWIERHQGGVEPAAVGHRVVHGGPLRDRPERIDEALLADLATLEPLAPHHQPHNLAAIRMLAERAPDLPQVACYDTAFHAGLPRVARRMPLPRALEHRGIVRYGFHGLSYEHLVRELPEVAGALPGRLLAFHLGNGCSAAAILDGRSIATTMGFSTIEGLMMATRAGAVDPGVLLHLLAEGTSAAELGDMLYNRSGLLGVSGISPDMRTLLGSDAPEAREAVELFCYRCLREGGSLVAVLGGLDAVVFTGGIGENAAPVRAEVLEGLAWLGVELDADANEAGRARITARGSPVAAFVLEADEESVIAGHSRAVLGL